LLLLLGSCASDLADSGEPYALINTRVLPVECVTSPVPEALLAQVEDPEAKLLSPSPDELKGDVGKAYRVTVDGAMLSGVYVIEPAVLLCRPFDAAGSTAAVSYRGGTTTELTHLRTIITFG
jgi:hypothetical protein